MTADQLDALARQSGKTYQGQFAWFTVVFGFAVFASYCATPLLVITGALPLWLGSILMLLFTYMAYTVLHDAAHGSISGSNSSLRWVNELMGYLSAFVLMIPLTAHRHEHLSHHRNTNMGEEDPDFVVGDMTRSPYHVLRAAGRIYATQFRYYMQHRWADAPRKQNQQFLAELAVSVGARLVFLAQGFWLEGLVMILVSGIGGVALLMYLFAYIVHHPHTEVGRYVDTSIIIAPKWCNGIVTWAWLFQNYHAIHHLFPRVPFYHYKKLYEEIEPAMRAHNAPIYDLTLNGLRNTSTS